MERDEPRIIDMTLTGAFVAPAAPPRPPVGARVMLWAIVAGVLAFAALMVVLALWVLAAILPVLLALGAGLYVAHRFNVWRLNRSIARWRPGQRDG